MRINFLLLYFTILLIPIISFSNTKWPQKLGSTLFKAESKNYPDQMHKYYYSPLGHAIIYYDTSGSLSIDTTDLNFNRIPDFVESVGEILEKVWAFEIDSLGHKEPIISSGWTNPFPIYLNETNVAYGATYFIAPGVSAGEFTQFPGYIQINPRLSKIVPSEAGEKAAKVTIAHELYHAIQFSYGVRFQDNEFTDLWLLEQTATAFEEFVFDEVNDYYQYLDKIQEFPWDNGIIRNSYFSYYGHCILYIMFYQQLGHINFMKQIWLEQFEYPGKEVLPRIAEINYTTFDDLLKDYGIWRYYTGSNWKPGYYEEGMNYPEVYLHEPQNQDDLIPHSSIEYWGLEYHSFLSKNNFRVNPSALPVLVHDVNNQKTAWFKAYHRIFLEKNINYIISFWDEDIPLILNSQNMEQVVLKPNPVFSKVNSLMIEKAGSGEFIDIYNSTGQRVLSTKADIEGNAIWDLRDHRGRIVASGVYFIQLKNSNRVGKCVILK